MRRAFVHCLSWSCPRPVAVLILILSKYGQARTGSSDYFVSMKIYAYGMISKSSLIRLDSEFPAENGYAEIADSHIMVSGETGNSAQVLAKWGHTVKVDGPWLGDNSADFIRNYLAERNVDCSRLHAESNYQGIEEVVLSSARSRTVLGGYKRLLFTTKQWNIPQEEDVAWADLVSIDPQFGDDALLAAELAQQHAKLILGIDCRLNDPILPVFHTLVIGEPYLQNWYGNVDREALFRQYAERFPGLLIFTRGEKPFWYSRAGEPTKMMDAYQVKVLDTAGAGDTFRAGLAHGMLQGWSDETMLRFSAAAAALNCTRFPGVKNSPSLQEIRALLSE